MKSEIQQKLEQLAYKRTTAFCYGCYIKAPKGVCPQCHSDDLMRHLDGVGCDWDINFAVEHILQEELTSIDTDATFEDMIRSCYPEETTVGWMKFDTIELMKSQDPISWKIARDEWISMEEDEGNILSFDNGKTYYYLYDLEGLLES